MLRCLITVLRRDIPTCFSKGGSPSLAFAVSSVCSACSGFWQETGALHANEEPLSSSFLFFLFPETASAEKYTLFFLSCLEHASLSLLPPEQYFEIFP